MRIIKKRVYLSAILAALFMLENYGFGIPEQDLPGFINTLNEFIKNHLYINSVKYAATHD